VHVATLGAEVTRRRRREKATGVKLLGLYIRIILKSCPILIIMLALKVGFVERFGVRFSST